MQSVRRTNVNTGHKFVAVSLKNDESVIQDLLAEYFTKDPESILPRLIRRRRPERVGLVCVEVHPGPGRARKAKLLAANQRGVAKMNAQNAAQGFGPGMRVPRNTALNFITSDLGAMRGQTMSNRVGFVNGRARIPGLAAVTAPASEGFIIPRSHFGFAGKPQALADYDQDRAVRVTGCGLFFAPVTAGSATPAAGFGGGTTYWVGITPTDIDPRLANIEKIFQFYAIRELRLSYIPAVGATTAVQVALGIAQDTQIQIAIPAPTQSQVLELNTSILTPAWQVATMTYTHRGTKLFNCYAAAAEENDTKLQASLTAVLLGAIASTTYGQLYVEYIVDFYEPTPILPTVN